MRLDESSGIERRRFNERRTYSVVTLKQSLTTPRRMCGRRKTDRSYPLLDRFDSGVVTLAIALMILSVVDSVFTLSLLARGGSEINPIMNTLLDHSVWTFSSFKMLLTAIPSIILAATGNLLLFNRWRARSILAALVGLYAGLIVYESILLSMT